jgi:ATP-dependent helicase YprA (DUF1998 family)
MVQRRILAITCCGCVGENLVLAAGTGSGKTLAYVLPLIQSMLMEEQLGYTRLVGPLQRRLPCFTDLCDILWFVCFMPFYRVL